MPKMAVMTAKIGMPKMAVYTAKNDSHNCQKWQSLIGVKIWMF